MGLFDKAKGMFEDESVEEDTAAVFEVDKRGGEFAFVDTNESGGYTVESARTGEVDDLGVTETVGFMQNAEPTGLAATEKNREAAQKATKFQRSSPLDIHTSRSAVSQGRDEAVRAEKVTTDPFEYAQNPDGMDFKGLDTPSGARSRRDEFDKGDRQYPELFD
jgi:hypothetical protein